MAGASGGVRGLVGRTPQVSLMEGREAVTAGPLSPATPLSGRAPRSLLQLEVPQPGLKKLRELSRE